MDSKNNENELGEVAANKFQFGSMLEESVSKQILDEEKGPQTNIEDEAADAQERLVSNINWVSLSC
jgi:hypothetical protein